MKHKYYISCCVQDGFVGLYYCLDYTLDTIDGIQKISEQLHEDGQKMQLFYSLKN